MKTNYYALLAFAFTVCIFPAKGSTYYISSSSWSDRNTSTQAQNPAIPWKTLEKTGLSWSVISNTEIN